MMISFIQEGQNSYPNISRHCPHLLNHELKKKILGNVHVHFQQPHPGLITVRHVESGNRLKELGKRQTLPKPNLLKNR